MLKGAVARRYAEAMFDLARKYNTLDPTQQDLQEIAQVFSNRKISYLLREPKIPARRKEAALRAALQGRIQDMSLNFALLLVQRELVEYAPGIASEYEQLLLNYRNQAVADVTTATPVDASQQATIKRALEERTGKTILMQSHVDPSILGGVIARVGDRIIDGSVRYRLNVLEQQLMNNVSSSTTRFFSQEELDETARAISTVDTTSSATTKTDTQATTQHTQVNGYNDVPAAPNNGADDQAQGLDQYDAVPDSKPSAYRS